MELEAGAIVCGRYKLERLLGEGGMGAVWAASHLMTRKGVALKFLKAAGAAHPDLIRRFIREARAASAVRHPNVVQIHDVLQLDDGLPVMVMDLLRGESLGEKVERERIISLPELARILVPVMSAIGTAHSLGIVHRDLKPDNIFLTRLGDERVQPMVLDFGIAKLSAMDGDAATTANLTKTGSMLGTPYYMSPEQAFGEKDVDHQADIWSLGVILYECLSGKRPVDGDNFGQLVKVLATGGIPPFGQVAPHFPSEIIDLVDRMLERDRLRRLGDLREAYEVLRHFTDASAPTFSAAVSVNEALPLSVSVAGTTTPGATQPGAAITADGGTTSSAVDVFGQTTIATPAKPKWPLAVLAVSLALVASTVVGVKVLRPAERTNASPVPAAGLVANAAVTDAGSALVPADGPTIAPAVSASLAAPVASIAPAVTPPRDGAKTVPKGPAKPAETKAQPATPVTPKVLPGGIPDGKAFLLDDHPSGGDRRVAHDRVDCGGRTAAPTRGQAEA